MTDYQKKVARDIKNFLDKDDREELKARIRYQIESEKAIEAYRQLLEANVRAELRAEAAEAKRLRAIYDQQL